MNGQKVLRMNGDEEGMKPIGGGRREGRSIKFQ
jgi:hypothetical protein